MPESFRVDRAESVMALGEASMFEFSATARSGYLSVSAVGLPSAGGGGALIVVHVPLNSQRRSMSRRACCWQMTHTAARGGYG